MKTETIQEFLSRGGFVTKCAPGPEKYDHSSKYKKDKCLQSLYALLKVDGLSDYEIESIEHAIDIRLQILKVSF